MSKTTIAELDVKVYVDCPHCGRRLDLMDDRDTSGVDHNDDCQVMQQACPEGSRIEAHENFEINNVKCSPCGEVFDVRGLDW